MLKLVTHLLLVLFSFNFFLILGRLNLLFALLSWDEKVGETNLESSNLDLGSTVLKLWPMVHRLFSANVKSIICSLPKRWLEMNKRIHSFLFNNVLSTSPNAVLSRAFHRPSLVDAN